MLSLPPFGGPLGLVLKSFFFSLGEATGWKEKCQDRKEDVEREGGN